jgi:hypothetical protein
MAVTYDRCKYVTVSLPKRFHNGRFTSETAVRRASGKSEGGEHLEKMKTVGIWEGNTAPPKNTPSAF